MIIPKQISIEIMKMWLNDKTNLHNININSYTSKLQWCFQKCDSFTIYMPFKHKICTYSHYLLSFNVFVCIWQQLTVKYRWPSCSTYENKVCIWNIYLIAVPNVFWGMTSSSKIKNYFEVHFGYLYFSFQVKVKK